MSQDYSYASPEPSPEGKRKIPRWLIVIGVIALLLCAAVGVFMCASPVIVYLLGPQIGNQFERILLNLDCATANPDLAPETCEAWAEKASSEHPGVMTNCNDPNDNSSEASMRRYQCVLDQGIDPP